MAERDEYALNWFRFAERDLASANHLLTLYPQPYEIICYLCEQSAEKYLKGYLIHKGADQPPRTHELDRLCELCGTYDSRFSEIKKACDVLADYGVQPRYPHEMEIHEHHVAKALEYAKQVQSFAPIAELAKGGQAC